MKKIVKIWILLLLVASIILGSIYFIYKSNKKYQNMQNIEFIPKEFNDVKLGLYETYKNPCSPGYPRDITDILWNKIVINAPQKIICTINDDTFIPVIPICGAHIVTDRRGFKYHDLGASIFHIRKIGNENWFTGVIIDKDLEYEFPALPPDYEEEQREWERNIAEAKKYTDEELEEGQASGGFLNVNLMEYVKMPFEQGIYEIYLSFSGLESNHVKVEIIFKE